MSCAVQCDFIAFAVQGYEAKPPGWLIYCALPIIGALLIVFCGFFRNGLQQVQKFAGLGVHLEITTLSLLAIFGVALMGAGLALYVYDSGRQWDEPTEKERKAEQRADAAERFTVRLVLAYPKAVPQELIPNTKSPGAQATNLVCKYKLASSSTTEQTQVTLGQQETVVIFIHDLARSDVIQDLTIDPSPDGNLPARS